MATDPLRDKLDQAADRADAASTAFYAVLTNNKETPVPVEGGTVDSMSKRIYDQVGAQIDAINEKADEATASATSANASKDAAANSATQANNAKTATEGARDTAVQAKDQAQTAAQASQASAVSAQSSASNSSNSASQAADSANTASTAANQSVQAKDAANLAKNAAQAAQASSESSKNAAATSASNSASSEAAAKGYSDAALAYRDSSLTNANSAAASATQSAASASASLTSAQEAKTAATSAASANTSAQSSKDAAATSAASASQSATNAASSATVAGQKETGAISAANSAEASKTQAQSASSSAQGFAAQAQASATEASGYLDDVEQSASDASASATSAQDSKDAAALSATAAQGSATSAASYASAASTSAQEAAASVASIGSAVSDAQAAAQDAESSATAAQASATQAANSAASITSTVEFAQYTFESESAMVTDGANLPDGAIVYLRDTGKTFEKSGNTYVPQVATNPIRAVLSYGTYAEAQLAAATLPGGQLVDSLDVQERYRVQGGALVFVELLRAYELANVASAVKRALNDKLSDVINLKDFGAICDGALHPLSERFSTLAMAQVAYPHATSLSDSIDWAALQAFIDWAKASGSQKLADFSGTLVTNREITWRSHAYLRSESRYAGTLRKAAGYNGRHIVSENFDDLTGTDAMTDTRTPYDFGLWEVTIDGQYIDAAKTTYTNTSGGGVFFYATGYQIKARVVSQAGVGVWLECTGAEDWSSPRQRQAYVNLTIGNTAEESLIFKGPSDVQIEAVNAYGAGAITATDPRNYTLWSSSTYPAKGRLDAIVFEQGCELDVMHTFGHAVGYGLFVSGGRFNADLVISEANLGALDYSGSAYGQINRLRAHNIKGGVAYVEPPHPSAGTMPSVVLRSNGFLDISSFMLERNGSGQTGQTDLLIQNGWNTIGSLKCNGFGKAGHVIKSTGGFSTIEGVLLNNVKGTASDGTASCGFIREHANNASTFCNIKGSIVNTDEGFRSTNSVRTEKIELQMTTVGIPFSGSQKAHLTQDWKISSTNTTLGETKTTTWYGSAAFDSTSTAKQTLTLTHTLIYAPPLDRITLGLDDSSTSFTDSGGALDFIVVRDRTSTTIVVDVKMRVANGVNTTPRVVVRAEL